MALSYDVLHRMPQNCLRSIVSSIRSNLFHPNNYQTCKPLAICCKQQATVNTMWTLVHEVSIAVVKTNARAFFCGIKTNPLHWRFEYRFWKTIQMLLVILSHGTYCTVWLRLNIAFAKYFKIMRKDIKISKDLTQKNLCNSFTYYKNLARNDYNLTILK